MEHQLKRDMCAKCATPQELRAAVRAIVGSGKCPAFSGILSGESDEAFPWIKFNYELTQTRACEAMVETYVPLHEFILRGMGLWEEGPNVKVAGHKAEFRKGVVQIGCTPVTNAEVREVYKHLID